MTNALVPVVVAVVVAGLFALLLLGEGPFYVGVLGVLAGAVVAGVSRPALRPSMYAALAGLAATFGVVIYGVSQFG